MHTHFRKKPVTIQAFHLNAENRRDHSRWPLWLNQAWNKPRDENGAVFPLDAASVDGPLAIRTLEGTMTVSIDDWIIRGIRGELYPCKPDVFDATYEPGRGDRQPIDLSRHPLLVKMHALTQEVDALPAHVEQTDLVTRFSSLLDDLNEHLIKHSLLEAPGSR